MRMQKPLTIRPAVAAERKALEALQWRASLANPGDREALLANPDAIDLPLAQIEAGAVFVAETPAGSILRSWTRSSSSPRSGGKASAARWWSTAASRRRRRVRVRCTSWATPTPKASTPRAGSRQSAFNGRGSASAC